MSSLIRCLDALTRRRLFFVGTVFMVVIPILIHHKVFDPLNRSKPPRNKIADRHRRSQPFNKTWTPDTLRTNHIDKTDFDMPKGSYHQSTKHNKKSCGGRECVVPKFVHLIWFHPLNPEFRFHHLISILSIQKYIKPRRILFWHDKEPTGPWWNFARRKVPNIQMIVRKPPTSIFGHDINVIEHQSDVARLEAILKYGGIYLDLDVIVLKSFDPLLGHNCTFGAESLDLLGSGVIIARPNASFIHLLYDQYRTFDDKSWNYHSVILPMRLARKFPNLVHVEWDSMHRPNWMERSWLYNEGKLWDWINNYTVHLWYRYHNKDYDPESIKYLNTTMGEIFRYIYYGKHDIWDPIQEMTIEI